MNQRVAIVADACRTPVSSWREAPPHRLTGRGHGRHPVEGDDVAQGTCSVEGCRTTGRVTRGWCSAHYERWRKHGSADVVREGGRPRTPLLDRLADKFLVGDGCWPWIAAKTSSGYGAIWDGERDRPAHCVVYELLVGPIPEGLDLDHECHNIDPVCPAGDACEHRACVRPSHLIPRTSAENLARSRHTSVGKKLARQGASW